MCAPLARPERNDVGLERPQNTMLTGLWTMARRTGTSSGLVTRIVTAHSHWHAAGPAQAAQRSHRPLIVSPRRLHSPGPCLARWIAGPRRSSTHDALQQ